MIRKINTLITEMMNLYLEKKYWHAQSQNQMQKEEECIIPKGEWYNFWDNELIKGGEEIWVDADIDSMPIFVKAGAIIPKYPIQQYVGEKEIDELVA